MSEENPYKPPTTQPRKSETRNTETRNTETRLERVRRFISQNPFMTLFIVLVAAFLLAEILGVFTGVQQTFVLP